MMRRTSSATSTVTTSSFSRPAGGLEAGNSVAPSAPMRSPTWGQVRPCPGSITTTFFFGGPSQSGTSVMPDHGVYPAGHVANSRRSTGAGYEPGGLTQEGPGFAPTTAVATLNEKRSRPVSVPLAPLIHAPVVQGASAGNVVLQLPHRCGSARTSSSSLAVTNPIHPNPKYCGAAGVAGMQFGQSRICECTCDAKAVSKAAKVFSFFMCFGGRH